MAPRIRTLELVTDLRRRAMEVEARGVSDLRSKIADLDARRAAMRAGIGEGGAASLEAAPYLPGYLRAMRAEEAKIDAERATLVAALARAEAQLRQRFRETQASEQVLGSAQGAARAKLAQAEREALEEIALRPWTGGAGGG